MIHAEAATVVGHSRLGSHHVRLRLHAPGVAGSALPGQFVNVCCTSRAFGTQVYEDRRTWLAHRRGRGTTGVSRLLMRPFAVHRVWTTGAGAGQIEILFKIVGAGTEALARKRAGDVVEMLGPLGRGFDLTWCRRLSSAAVVAGGVGVAPLFPLVRFLREQDVQTVVIVGALRETDLPLETADSRVTLSFMSTRPELTLTGEALEDLGCTVGIVTLEGTKGYIGLPTDMLDRYLHWTDGGARGEAGVFTCGPWGMMQAVARHAEEHDLRCQVLLEERMGCGIGACMACACGVRGADGVREQRRVCVDGPVFDASEVIWDDI